MTEPRRARRAAVAGARAAGATIGVGIAALAIVTAAFLPIPSYSVAPPALDVTPVATPQQLVCPGAALTLGDSEGKAATTAAAVGAATISSGSTQGEAVATPFGTDQGSPVLLTSSSADDTTATVSGSQAQVVEADGISGFAAAGCSSVSTDAWLVGGATTTGRTTLVTLANPGDVASTVSLDIYGENGAVSAAGATGIEVDAGSQRVLSLAGFAPDTVSPIVHVTSTGGHIVATLQESIVRGLESAGLDIVTATTNPALRVVVPGLVVQSPDDLENRIAQSDDNIDLKTVVRLFVPGSTASNATVNVVPEGDGATGLSFDAALDPGVVTDVPVEGLTAGTYTVIVTSSEPVVGAVRLSTASTPDGGAATTDVAWLASPTPIHEATAFTVAQGPSPVLHIANASEADIEATVTPGGGSPQQVAVPARSSVSVPVTAGTTYGFESTAAVSASVGYSSANQLANITVDPRLADAEQITVYP
jgi:hypothetical protein